MAQMAVPDSVRCWPLHEPCKLNCCCRMRCMTSTPALRGSAAASPLHCSCSTTSAESDLGGDSSDYDNDKTTRHQTMLMPSTAVAIAPICALLLLGALAWKVAGNQASAVAMDSSMASPWQVGARAQHPTLVIYIYSPTDPGGHCSQTLHLLTCAAQPARGQKRCSTEQALSVASSEYGNNLRYFVRHGLAAGDGVDYIIVVQRACPGPCLLVAPALAMDMLDQRKLPCR